MSTPQKTAIDEKPLLDWGARIGLAAKQEEIDSTQLENLIASLDAVEGRAALLATAAFALRQAKRLRKGGMTAKIASQALLDLYDKNLDKEQARKMLRFAKWVYEAIDKLPGDLRPERVTLEELLRRLAGR